MSEEILRVLIIELSLEDGEQQLSTLRNAGIAVRPTTVEDEEELNKVVEEKALDLVLLNSDHPDFSITQVSDVVNRAGKDIPVIALIDDFNVETASAALEAGARNVVSSEHPQFVENVVRAEFENLEQRRKTRRLDASLRETEKRCHALLDSSRDAIAYVHEGMHIYANPAYLQLFDYTDFEDLEGLPILDMVVGDDAGKLRDVLKELSKGNPPPDEIEVKLAMPDGSPKEAVMEFSSASIEGEPCTQIVLRDKSVDPELAKELRDLKTQDLVTGLHNRQFMVQSLQEAITATQQESQSHSLVMLEIDNFKSVLEQVGLAGVDLLLGDIAKLIRDCQTESEIAGRMADHTFVILCKKQPMEHAAKIGEAIRAAVEGHISEISDKSVTLTVSVGVSRSTESVTNPQDLLSMVSGAMRQASSAGGNKVEIYDPAKVTGDDADDSLHWIERIKEGLNKDKFLLVYQPIVSLFGAEDQIYEVLLRLQTDDDDEIAAGKFLPHVAGHEIMIKIDQWVIQHAVAKLKTHREENPDAKTQFFIKLSNETLARPEVLRWIAKVLQKYRMSGDCLVFEAPESKLMTNLKPARQFLKGLQQLHCKFAIEQFGSGLNSFQILKHLPAEYLKIDRAFMKGLPKSQENQDKIKEITDQAHAQGKVTVAEFVEDAASMAILYSCGVNFVQGNFLQEPEKVLAYEFG
ncbi:MAG: EAL domain-containing protein [Xanthomonadales bacterium]|nr:EAL domain-containing protein [Xanthomonadales bacterium]